ncbi:larval cuticle protein 16/17-like [Cimex lectularius]|uniref:CPR type cuticle protein n=1 Tax=Cimex lectularius TaxID=79782 RepID=A0A8I6RJ21_CIMLE|nr:larval cuticle protein 16/17-like [Cimex lectularius]
MKTAIVLVALFGCCMAQLPKAARQSQQVNRGGQARNLQLVGGQTFYQPSLGQVQYQQVLGAPVVSHYSVPVQQLAVKQYHVPVAAPVSYSAPSVRTSVVKPVAVLSQYQDVSHDGSFTYGFQSEDGVSVQASGSLKALGPEETAQVVQGSYTYTAPDGTPVTTNWYADETGFHAEGDHLPKAPEGHTRTY